MFVVRRMDLGGNGVFTFECEMERLDTGTVTSSVSGSMPAGLDPTQHSAWQLSDASQHFLEKTGVLGPVISFDGTATADINTAKAWLRNHYSGSVESGASGGSSASTSWPPAATTSRARCGPSRPTSCGCVCAARRRRTRRSAAWAMACWGDKGGIINSNFLI